jgi:hypothetical protein
MSNPTLKLLPALMIAIAAALLTQPVRATAVDTLLITENNSTSTGLTAMLTTSSGTTSLPVTFNAADAWFIALTGISASASATSPFTQNWFEPEAGFVNEVSVNPRLFPNQLFVRSDQGPGFTLGLADDTTDMTHFTLSGVSLWVTFDDDGDVAAPVPDTGSTLGLLSLSVVALLGATRLRFLQLAA